MSLMVMLVLGLAGERVLSAEKSVVFIDVSAVLTTNRLTATDDRQPFSHFTVKNLKTGRSHTVPETQAGWPSVLRVPTGVYCLNSIHPYVNVRLKFCDEPFFRVLPGVTNNAGRWRFGISHQPSALTLIEAMVDLEGVAEEAKQRYPKLFKQDDGAH